MNARLAGPATIKRVSDTDVEKLELPNPLDQPTPTSASATASTQTAGR